MNVIRIERHKNAWKNMKQYRSQKRQNEKIQTIYSKEKLGSGDTSDRKHKR